MTVKQNIIALKKRDINLSPMDISYIGNPRLVLLLFLEVLRNPDIFHLISQLRLECGQTPGSAMVLSNFEATEEKEEQNNREKTISAN